MPLSSGFGDHCRSRERLSGVEVGRERRSWLTVQRCDKLLARRVAGDEGAVQARASQLQRDVGWAGCTVR